MIASHSKRILELIAREEAAFRRRLPRSKAMWQQASRVIPRGVPSSFQDRPPQPIFIERGEGSLVWDVDGNQYVDFHNGFGAMVVGHAHPAVVAAVSHALHRGSHFAQPVEDCATVAAELARRFGQPKWRFCNSGTEATLDAVRLARALTGRERIIKIEGSYHGHHDSLMVSVEPPLELAGPSEQPASVPYSKGIPRATVELVTVVPFNDIGAMERALATGPIAAVVVEPAMMNIGFVLPDDGYLAGVRELCTRHGAALIFDEVKTGITIASGGATERFGVIPDIVCLAKAIGGGLPCGAIGGSEAVMGQISDGSVAQIGTFNGNPLTMAASRATLCDVLTPDAYVHLEGLTATLRKALERVVASYELESHVVAMAARGCITHRAERVRNYRDTLEIDTSFAYLSSLYQRNRGVLMSPGADENDWTLSVQHSPGDVLRYAENFEELAAEFAA